MDQTLALWVHYTALSGTVEFERHMRGQTRTQRSFCHSLKANIAPCNTQSQQLRNNIATAVAATETSVSPSSGQLTFHFNIASIYSEKNEVTLMSLSKLFNKIKFDNLSESTYKTLIQNTCFNNVKYKKSN